MSIRSLSGSFTRLAVATFLSAAVGISLAQGPPDHGRPDQHQNGHDSGQDFHFRDQDRAHFQSHYQKDASHWQQHPQNRPHFERGQRIPPNYRFQPVPQSYYRDVPPPPQGYQYGYYDGYVVAYNPTTRVIADVLDLVGAAAGH